MAISKRNASLLCFTSLMLVMATLMLPCYADRKEYCGWIKDGCTYHKCKDWCAGQGYPKRFKCVDAENCCCLLTAKPRVDVVRRYVDRRRMLFSIIRYITKGPCIETGPK
uniref:Knottin scorpion toxin-like domain-containing protein n=1 Tax=Aegilops tauschii subsp. strangulata TaxID=200361 RepID=A0A453DGI6_AEGTS